MSCYVHTFLQNKHIVLKVFALSRSYLDFLGILKIVSTFMPKLCFVAFNTLNMFIISQQKQQQQRMTLLLTLEYTQKLHEIMVFTRNNVCFLNTQFTFKR